MQILRNFFKVMTHSCSVNRSKRIVYWKPLKVINSQNIASRLAVPWKDLNKFDLIKEELALKCMIDKQNTGKSILYN